MLTFNMCRGNLPLGRVWIIRHLMPVGVPTKDLCSRYIHLNGQIDVGIRCAAPVLVYASMLNVQQGQELEKLQKSILKTIHGYKMSYKEALDLKEMLERREICVQKFAAKLKSNHGYQHWLPLNPRSGCVH